jgi:DNA-binding SARP family transcriptional activator
VPAEPRLGVSLDGGEVRFAVLGPVRAWRGGAELELGHPKQRAVLAALLVREGAQVTLGELIDGVWGDEAPATAAKVIRSYVYQLRLVLGRDGAGPIRSAGGGYALEAGAEVDLARFAELAARGRRARGGGDPAGAAALFAEGLGLWSGTALAGIPGPYAAAQRTRLGELRLTGQEEYLGCLVELGSYDQAAAELSALIAGHPLRERLRELQMRALYGAGRPGEALAAFRRAARLLRDELGIEPGPGLRAMHQRILGNDPALLSPTPAPPPAPAPPPPSPPVPVPAQLPADIAHFTGRDAELDALTALARNAGSGVVVTAIGGTAGIGKTALAVHWAHQAAAAFPDGQLYVNLRGFDPAGTPLPPEAAVRGFLHALAVPPERIPADPDAQAALYRSLLAGRRMLIVLDNARGPAQVRPLLPGAPGSLVLVTSRSQLTGLAAVDGTHSLTLDLLSPQEARDLLTRRLGAERVTAEPEAAGELAGLCARLPLALNITAARAAARPDFPLTALAAQLRHAPERLASLDTGDVMASVRAVLSWSYRALSPAAARTFRLLGIHPGPDITIPAAASLTAASREQAAAALKELSAASLLTEHARGRYAFHDLLRAYAADQAGTHDTETERHQALHRALDHYLHTGYAADRLLSPVRTTIPLSLPEPGTAPEELADDQQAWRWLEAEHPVLLAAVEQASVGGFDLHACQLPWTLMTFLDRQGKWHDSVAAQAISLAAAQRLGNLAEQASSHRNLGISCARLGSYPDADAHLHRALDLYRQLGDYAGQGATHYNLATTLERQGCYREALDHARQSLELHRTGGNQAGQAMALNAVGWLCSLLGDHQQALAHCQLALALHRSLGNRAGEAETLDSLGHTHQDLGHHRQAIECYRQALALLRTFGHRYEQAGTLTRLGDTHHAAGDRDAARDAWEQAQVILEDLQHPDAEQLRHKLKPPALPAHDVARSPPANVGDCSHCALEREPRVRSDKSRSSFRTDA